MGVLTSINSTYSDDEQVQRIFVVTKWAPSTRASINRVTSRMTAMTGVGQRTLVAAAYDEFGIDMVWREGPFSVMSPEEKWPDAQEIKFTQVEIERASEFLDIAQIDEDAIPGGNIYELVFEDWNPFRRASHLMMWEIPYDVGGRGI